METLVKQLQSIGLNRHRYKVFEDFITISAITLHNAGLPNSSYVFKRYEQEYLKIIHTCDKNDQQAKKLGSALVEIVKVEPNSVINDKSPLPSVPKIVPVEQLGFEF